MTTLERPPSQAQEAATAAPNGAETLVRLFVEQGVEYLFLNPGTDTAPLQEALVALALRGERVPTVVPCLYENVALAAAHAYWDVTHRPQVVVVHVDVGTQNLGGNLHNAQRAHAGVVILAGRAPYTLGDVPGSRDRPVQWQQDQLDQHGIVRNYVKWSHDLGRPDTLQQLVPRAFQVAAAQPSGPVYMTVAREVLLAPVPSEPHPSTLTVPAPGGVDPAALLRLAHRLVVARAPLAITGRVGRNPAAVPELVALAELLALPVADARGPVNFPSSHPLYLGGEARAALQQADCVLLLDVDVPWIPRLERPPDGAFIAQIDIDPVKVSIPLWGFAVDLAMQADTAVALSQLRTAVEMHLGPEHRQHIEERRQRVAAETASQRQKAEEAARQVEARSPITVTRLAQALSRLVPDEALVLDESTTSSETLRRYLRRDVPGTLLHGGGPGLGWLPGGALGAKLAAPDRDVIALCGDGSFIFGSPIAALWAAQQARAPFLVVICNNGGYNASKVPVQRLFPKGASVQADSYPGVRFPTPPDYAAIARACHAHGERVEDPAELEAALQRGLEATRQGTTGVIDVALEPI